MREEEAAAGVMRVCTGLGMEMVRAIDPVILLLAILLAILLHSTGLSSRGRKEGRKEGRIYGHENNMSTALLSTGIRLLKDPLLAI